MSIHLPETGPAIVVSGDYENLWILMLSVEESLCAANNSVRIKIEEGSDVVKVSVTHDGADDENSSGFVRDLIFALAPALAGAVYYDTRTPFLS